MVLRLRTSALILRSREYGNIIQGLGFIAITWGLGGGMFE